MIKYITSAILFQKLIKTELIGDNMLNKFSRTELLLGVESMEKLKNSRVAVFGVGGVGGYAVYHSRHLL